MHARAAELIDRLRLEVHPEGGYYREVHRSGHAVDPQDGREPRAAVTTILFLLTEGGHSRWHRVASDEVWHFYEGAPLELLVAAPAIDAVERVVLGSALATDGPVYTVPAHRWQAARPTGGYALVGCTVGPGFDFADFEFLRDAPGVMEKIQRLHAGSIHLA